jgi:hypothetical protein
MKTKILITAIITSCATFLFAQPQLPFTAYSGNPVLEHGPTGSWDTGNILSPYILNEDTTYYLYYSSSLDFWSEPSSIGLAISTDGYEFDKVEDPVFVPDGTGFDAWSVSYSVVIKDNGGYIHFYNGKPDTGTVFGPYIGQATATKPEGPWDSQEYPILEAGSAGEWDSQIITPESVINTDSGLVMYYSGINISPPMPFQIGMAYFNGNTWVKYDDPLTTDPPYAESDPVLPIGSPGSWDDENTAHCHVNKIATGLEMFYTGSTSNLWNIGYATSEDGIIWVKHLQNPIYSYLDDPFAVLNGYHVAANPTIMIKDDKYFMYYDYGLMGPGYISLATGDVIPGIDDKIDLCSGRTMNIFPNPVKEESTIHYFIESKSPVKLSIHNLNGQLISTLINEFQQQGEQRVIFNSDALPAGVYFCVLKTN